MRTRHLLGCTAALIGAYAACSSYTAPAPPMLPSIAGSWFDSTSLVDQVDPLSIDQHGDSVVVVSPAYYLHFVYGANEWWSREGNADTATGLVTRDSVALCDAAVGPPCPNEIAYLRGNTLVLYSDFASVGDTLDTTGLGFTFVRGKWSTPDTIAPPNAPAPVQVSGVWLSDSLTGGNASCPAVAQIGLVVSSAIDSGAPATLFQLDNPLYDGQEWVRRCGSSTWTSASGYTVSALPFPCTPADRCMLSFVDTALTSTDDWLLSVADADSVVDATPSALNTGVLPPFFLRDSGVTSLMGIARRRPQTPAPATRTVALGAAGLRARLEVIRARRHLAATGRGGRLPRDRGAARP